MTAFGVGYCCCKRNGIVLAFWALEVLLSIKLLPNGREAVAGNDMSKEGVFGVNQLAAGRTALLVSRSGITRLALARSTAAAWTRGVRGGRSGRGQEGEGRSHGLRRAHGVDSLHSQAGMRDHGRGH